MRFNRDIRPIMSETCFHCHGPATQKAGLRLDVRERALRGERQQQTRRDHDGEYRDRRPPCWNAHRKQW